MSELYSFRQDRRGPLTRQGCVRGMSGVPLTRSPPSQTLRRPESSSYTFTSGMSGVFRHLTRRCARTRTRAHARPCKRVRITPDIPDVKVKLLKQSRLGGSPWGLDVRGTPDAPLTRGVDVRGLPGSYQFVEVSADE